MFGGTLFLSMRIYLFALLCGLRCLLKGAFINGLKFLIAPVGYWRVCPFTMLEGEFRACGAKRVLDVGSPKLMSIRFAALGARVVATDLNDPAVFLRWLPTARALGLSRYTAEFQDAQRLTYPESSFDLAYSISVIEHIPENGDSLAIDEMLRVVRPGGKVVIEVPSREKGEEIFRKCDSKGAAIPAPAFYERRYDEQMADERLGRGRRCSRIVLGETLAFDPWISGERKLPKFIRALLWPLEPIAALCNFGSNRRHQLSLFMVFERAG
jgi:SAM-dependent methyltransferase